MDQFFKRLRGIQKKERANSSLARVGSNFYKKTYKHLDKLKANIGNDPFSNEHYLLKDIQRIATEICERREHKITDAAVMNIQRSYHLFKGKPKFDLNDSTPLNLTNEEEKLYFSLIDTLKNHRQSISLDKLTEGLDYDSTKTKPKLKDSFKNNSQNLDVSNERIANDIIKDNNILNKNEKQLNNEKPIKTANNSDDSYSGDEVLVGDESDDSYSSDEVLVDERLDNDYSNDEVLNRLNTIKNAKVIENEVYENVNKQLNKSLKESQAIGSKSTDFKENPTHKNVKSSENDLNESKNLSEDSKIVNETILIFKKVGAIVGVDEKIYGPFYPQDIVVMPFVNANIIIKNKKGRLVKI